MREHVIRFIPITDDDNKIMDICLFLDTDTEVAHKKVTALVVMLEGRVIPCINEIVAYLKSTYDRYNKQSDLFKDKICLLDTTANEVKKHSEQIRELQLKQA